MENSAKIAALERRVEALEKVVLKASRPAKPFAFQNSEGFSATGYTQKTENGWRGFVEGMADVAGESEAEVMSKLVEATG